MQIIISKAIKAVSEKYKGHEMGRIAENNPLVMKQLNYLMDRVDRAVLSGDLFLLKREIKIWESTWLFWIGRYKGAV